MEPVSVVGIAAGAVQFADFSGRLLLESVSFLRNLRYAPKKIDELIQDLERSIERISALQNAAARPSSVLSQLPAAQVQRFTGKLQAVYHAMVDFQTYLISLSSTTGTSRTARSWRAIISVAMEKIIMDKMIRIDRLDKEVLAELEIKNLGLAYELKTILKRVDTSQEASRQDTVNQSTDMKSNMLENKNSIDRIKETVSFLGSDLRQESISIQQAIRQASQGTDVQLTVLRNDVLQAITAQDDKFRLGQLDASPFLGRSERDELLQQVVAHLASSPKSLRQACEAPGVPNALEDQDPLLVDYTGHAKYRGKQQQSWHTLTLCLFPLLRKTIDIVFRSKFGAGGFSLSQTIRSYNTVRRSESLAFYLFDDLPNICAKASNNRNLVSRTRLFGNFQGLYLKKSDSIPWFEINAYEDSISRVYYKWNKAVIKTELDQIYEKLRNGFQDGHAYATDKDENGNTLLHAMCFLCSIIGPDCYYVAQELRRIANLVITSGVDVHALCRKTMLGSVQTPSTTIFGGSIQRISTTSDVLMNIVVSLSPTKFPSPMPLYSVLSDLLLEQNPGAVSHLIYADPEGSNLRILRQNPYLFDFLEFSELERAVFFRDDHQTDLLIAKKSHRLRELLDTGLSLGPLELAIGYPHGLSKLAVANFIRVQAVLISISQNDLKTIENLLANHDLQIDNDDTWSLVMHHLPTTTDTEIIEIVIHALRRQRQKLRELADRTLSRDRCLQLTESEELLDGTASAVYQALLDCSTDVPSTLNPALGSSCSTYHAVLYRNRIWWPQIQECLFEAGFRAVDYSGWVEHDSSHHETLFYDLFFTEYIPGQFSDGEAMLWLLNKGVSIRFTYSRNFPNLLHCLAAKVRRHIYHGLILPLGDGLFKPLMKLSNEDCEILSADSCTCSCTCSCLLNGCSPVHKFWKCNYFLHAADPHNWSCMFATQHVLSKTLREWLQTLEVDDIVIEICYEAVCRVEIFDRLNMKHTCCNRRRKWPGAGMWQEMKGTEIEELEKDEVLEVAEEDSQSRGQLDLLMHAYKSYRRSCGGHVYDSWETWWAMVDKILPEPPPVQRCSTHGVNMPHFRMTMPQGNVSMHAEKLRKIQQNLAQARANQERQALQARHYSGLDFIEVIRRHFATYLERSHTADALYPTQISKKTSSRSPDTVFSPQGIRDTASARWREARAALESETHPRWPQGGRRVRLGLI